MNLDRKDVARDLCSGRNTSTWTFYDTEQARRGGDEIKSARLPHRLRQSIYLAFHSMFVINFFIVEGFLKI